MRESDAISSPEAVNCLNCEAQYVGSYCPQCGQKKSLGRLRLKPLLKEVVETEHGFFHTLVDLTIRPRQMIQSYLNGRRSRYVTAFKYTLFMALVFAFT